MNRISLFDLLWYETTGKLPTKEEKERFVKKPNDKEEEKKDE